MVERSKKVFFSVGDKGALVIIDVWIKWLIAKPTNNLIYWFGAFLLKIPYFPKICHDIISGFSRKSKKKKIWSFQRMKTILDNSAYLILDLKENEDFSFDDIDEAKKAFRFSQGYVAKIYAHDSDVNNPKMEYWNMHTYSDKIIEKNKIKLLKVNNSCIASDVIKYFAKKNNDFVKNNCKSLHKYLTYINFEI